MTVERDAGIDSGMGQLVLYRLTTMEDAVRALTDQVSKSVVVEDRQNRMYEAQERAFKAIAALDKRMRVLELAQPITARTNVWAERVVLVVMSGVATVFLKQIFGGG